MSEAATDIFDQHPLWEEIDNIKSWLEEVSTKFGPDYEGIPSLANDFLNRIQVAVETTRLYLQLSPKEAISKALLDELKAPLSRINVELQTITLENGTDFDQDLGHANEAADTLLSALNKLVHLASAAIEGKLFAENEERTRISEYLNNAQSIVSSMRQELESHKQTISEQLREGRDELKDLREQIEEVSESYTEQIDDGVTAGKKRIDDQISTLQNQYNSQIESQSQNASETLRRVLNAIETQKKDLDKMIEDTKRVSGYIAENEMSRRFKERADDTRTLWLGFTVAATVVAIVSALIIWDAGQVDWMTTTSSSDIVRGVIRALMGIGSAAIAAYLFRQASIQQRIFQDFRSAEVRLGSLDAFLARFDEEDAQAVRRGVGKRVYIDGELGEIEYNDSRSAQNEPSGSDTIPTASTQQETNELDK